MVSWGGETKYLSDRPRISKVELFTTKEVEKEIRHLNFRKAPGLDRITPRLLKELLRKRVVLITYIFTSILRESHWPERLNTAEIILIPKLDKDLNNVESSHPISLQPIIVTVLKRLLIERIKSDPNTNEWMLPYQLGFRELHSTVQETHRITQYVNEAFERKEYCTAAFLDISQKFDKVWYKRLMLKIKNCLRISYFKLL